MYNLRRANFDELASIVGRMGLASRLLAVVDGISVGSFDHFNVGFVGVTLVSDFLFCLRHQANMVRLVMPSEIKLN